MNRFHPHFTHALTLTFDERHIWRFENDLRNPTIPTAEQMLAKRKQSFRHFGQRLSRLLFGNACQRSGEKLLIIGCLEGLRAGERPHYHCSLGVPKDRFPVLGAMVSLAWSHTHFAGIEPTLKPYYSNDWISYSTKNARYVDRECIDWDNVRIPASLLAHC